MNEDIRVQYISTPKDLPALFIPLPEDWRNRMDVLDKMGRLTNIKLGDVYILEIPMGKTMWRIIGAEVLNASEILQTDEVPALEKTIPVLAEDR